LQSIWPALVCKRIDGARLHYQRERWTTPDADFIDVDWLEPEASASDPAAPLLILFHGLEGSSSSHYARAYARVAQRLGWRYAVPHFRGCSGEPNRLARAYHSGDSAEIDWVLRRLKALAGTRALFAVGVSLGGNALLKWLGEQGPSAGSLLGAAVAISAPIDLAAAGDWLARGFNRVYTRMFLNSLKARSLEKWQRYPMAFDRARMLRARNLRQFDDVVTAALHGFDGVEDYYRRASAKPWLRHIRLPTLMISARNDPFVPSWSLPQADALSSSVTAEFPAEGGHVGFVSGSFPGHLQWLPTRVLEFFQQQV
jgi:predicted alpha/beta-fold hydrolase